MKTLILSVILFCVSSHVKNKVSIENIFKLNLFIEEAFEIEKNGIISPPTLSDLDDISFKIDTVISSSHIFISSISDIILFKTNLINKVKEDKFTLLFQGGNCLKYYIALDKTNGKFFRLYGFKTNDFLNLLRELRNKSGHKNEKALINDFSQTYGEDLDFNCIYNGLRSKSYDECTYPCLKVCTDGMPAHGCITK